MRQRDKKRTLNAGLLPSASNANLGRLIKVSEIKRIKATAKAKLQNSSGPE
jgi:hypothetical protein